MVLNIKLRHLPPNSAELAQPADSFAIKAIKIAWFENWDQHKFEQSMSGTGFRDGLGQEGLKAIRGNTGFYSLLQSPCR